MGHREQTGSLRRHRDVKPEREDVLQRRGRAGHADQSGHVAQREVAQVELRQRGDVRDLLDALPAGGVCKLQTISGAGARKTC